MSERMQVNYQLYLEPRAEISLTTIPSERVKPFPRLTLGSLSIYPTMDQLVDLAEVLGDYLGARLGLDDGGQPRLHEPTLDIDEMVLNAIHGFEPREAVTA